MLCAHSSWCSIIIVVVVRPEKAITFGALFNDKVFKLTFCNVFYLGLCNAIDFQRAWRFSEMHFYYCIVEMMLAVFIIIIFQKWV